MALTKVTGQVIKNTTDVTVGVLTVTNTLAVGGTVSIGGTLTYEDVTNVDAVGLITARNGIVVGSGITLSKDGDVFFTGIATGNGSGLTALNASNIGSGTVPTARLGSGTASSSTFLRGDSTFQTVNTDLVSDTSPQLGGNLDVNTKNIVFGDSASSSDDRLQFGASQDLEIYHNGSASYIKDSGTGYLLVLASGFAVQNAAGSETIMSMVEDGAVDLYYNDSKKFETTSTGVKITGKLIFAADNHLNGIELGADQDINLYHDGNDAYFDNGTGDFYIRNAGDNPNQIYIQGKGGENSIVVNGDGAVELYHDNTKKFETTSGGADVSGDLVIDGAAGGTLTLGGSAAHTSKLVIADNAGNGNGNLLVEGGDGTDYFNILSNGNVRFEDSKGAYFGGDSDLQMYHNNSHSYIAHNGTGDFYFGCYGASERLFFVSSGDAKWRLNPDGALKAGTHIDGGDGGEGANYHMHMTANFTPQKACLLLEDYSYYSDGEALRINNADSNTGRLMEDVQFTRTDSLVGYIRIHGGSVTYSTSGSDRRLKKNFEDWTEDNLSKFKTLSPQLFNWNTEEDGTAKTKGFIAQDNLEKFPEAYSLTVSTDRYYFNPSGMVHYLMKAMQEAAIKIETLEAEVAALKSS